jgi:hypothetical protein
MELVRVASGNRDDHRCAPNGPRIRLRVSQPKITLRLKLGDANQHGKKNMKRNRKETKKKRKKGKTQK